MLEPRDPVAGRAGLWVLGACALWLVVQNSVLVAVLVSRLDMRKVLAVSEAILKTGVAIFTHAAPWVWGALLGVTVAAVAGAGLLFADVPNEGEAQDA